MKKLFLISILSGLFAVNFTYAVDNSEELNNNLNEISGRIDQLNRDLDRKEQQKQKLDAALKDSQDAVDKTQELLERLRRKRSGDVRQLDQLAKSIPQLTDAVNKARNHVNQSMNYIYQEIKQIQNAQQSILNGNEGLQDSRKEVYLLEILKLEQAQYKKLNDKLTKLQELNAKLQNEIDRLDDQLSATKQSHQRLITAKEQNLQQASNVQKQIINEKDKLSSLKQRQVQLSKLLQQLALNEKREKVERQAAVMAARSPANSNAQLKFTVPDTGVENNSPFLARKLVKPINGKILVDFGQMRDNVRSNGILVAAHDNTPVFSVSGGTVLFSGELPGFGQIIVIDNGDNYNSVYSGVISKVVRGAQVKTGQQIAFSGDKANQPMNGVYFELRHLGRPVNPDRLFD